MNMNSAELQRLHFDEIRVRRVVERIFLGYTGSLGVRVWDGTVISSGRDKPVATIVVHTANLLREFAWWPDPLRLPKAYFFGEIDVEGISMP